MKYHSWLIVFFPLVLSRRLDKYVTFHVASIVDLDQTEGEIHVSHQPLWLRNRLRGRNVMEWSTHPIPIENAIVFSECSVNRTIFADLSETEEVWLGGRFFHLVWMNISISQFSLNSISSKIQILMRANSFDSFFLSFFHCAAELSLHVCRSSFPPFFSSFYMMIMTWKIFF